MKPFRNISNVFLNYSKEEYAEMFSRNLEFRGFHTDIIDEISIVIHKKAIALISIEEGQINFVGVVKKSGKIASKKSRIRIEYIKEFDPKIDAKEILKYSKNIEVSNAFEQNISKNNIAVIPYQIWNDIMLIIKQNKMNFTKVKNAFDRLMDKALNEDDKIEETNGFEKDALSFVLKCSGFDSFGLDLSHFDISNDSTPSFLQSLKTISIREDLMIIHDSSFWVDYNIIDKNIVYTTLASGTKKLSIMYSNRMKLEETLGVDLIYIDDQNKAIVMVQYKRLTGRSDKKYIPNNDNSYNKEMDTLGKIESIIKKVESSKYRFNDEAFYFKLCKDIQPISNIELIDGMYLPLNYWKYLIEKNNDSKKVLHFPMIL